MYTKGVKIMKIMYKSLLVLTIILLTGCSLKGSMGQPIEENPSELQQAVESYIDNNNNLEDKANDAKNAADAILDNLNEQENNEITE